MRSIRSHVAALTVLSAGLTAMAPAVRADVSPETSPPVVIGLNSFGRSVAHLESAVAFYRDVMGMQVIEREIPQPVADKAMQALTGAPGAKFRSVHLRVAYTPITLELSEFSNIAQTPIEGTPGQPGIPWLTLSVKDDAAFDVIDASHPRGFSLFGNDAAAPGANQAPFKIPRQTGFGAVLKGEFIRDTDGFLLEVLRRDPKSWFTVADPILLDEQSDAAIAGPSVVGLQFVLWERIDDALRFYYELLGFDIRPGYTRTLKELETLSPALPTDEECKAHSGGGMTNMASQAPASGCWSSMPGPPGAARRASRGASGNCAGVRCEFFENDPPGKPYQPRIQDPGAGFLTLWVRNLDALVARMKAAGVEIVSSGGRPVRIGDSRRIMVRDFSRGFYVVLAQKD